MIWCTVILHCPLGPFIIKQHVGFLIRNARTSGSGKQDNEWGEVRLSKNWLCFRCVLVRGYFTSDYVSTFQEFQEPLL